MATEKSVTILEDYPSFTLQSEQTWDNLQGRSQKIVVFAKFWISDFETAPLDVNFRPKSTKMTSRGAPVLKFGIRTYITGGSY